jgi:hypothetical protein
LSFSPTLRKSKARTRAAAEAKAIADAEEATRATAMREAKARWLAEKSAAYASRPAAVEAAVFAAVAEPDESRQIAAATAPVESKTVAGTVVESVFSRTSLIALDTLENLGIGEHFPMYLVVHGDKRHVHAHAVVALFVAGSPPSQGFQRAKKMLRSIARSVDLAHGLPRTSGKLKARHRAVLDSMVSQDL